MKIFKIFKKNYSRQKDVMIGVIKVTHFSRNSQKEITINVVTLWAKEQHTLQRDGRPRVGHDFFTKQRVGYDGGFCPVFRTSGQQDIVTDCWHPTPWPSVTSRIFALLTVSKQDFLQQKVILRKSGFSA
jgi:hypothetical protein